MTDLLCRGNKALERIRNRFVTTLVDIERDGGLIHEQVKATIGQSESETVNSNDVIIVSHKRDFIISTSLIGQLERGDVILEIVNGTKYRFEVLPMPDEPEERFADPYHEAYRIHTKNVGTVEV